MIILARGVIVFFIPYVSLWGIRNFIAVVAGKIRHAGT